VTKTAPFPVLKYIHPRYWLTWFGLAALRIIALLPYTLQLLCGNLIGLFILILPIPQKKIIQINVRLCFPKLSEQKQNIIIRKNYFSMGMSIIEIAMSWWSSNNKMKKLAHIEGLENLSAALENGNGVILLSPHFTTLEIGGKLLRQFTTFNVMYRHQKNELFNEIMTRARERNYETAIHRNDARKLLKVLKNNNAVWYAPDQHFFGEQKVFVPFFNIPAATNPATSRIVKISHAKVVPFFQERLPGLKGYRLSIQPALENFPRENSSIDTALINTELEKLIKKCPNQYLWAHKRFKTHPEKIINIYK